MALAYPLLGNALLVMDMASNCGAATDGENEVCEAWSWRRVRLPPPEACSSN